MAKRVNQQDIEEIQWDATMELVGGIVLHVLDKVSISGKWHNRNIGIDTLLAKRKTLQEMQKWMKTWQWNIWVNIYSQHNKYNGNVIKKRFESIRKKSYSYVSKKIKETKNNNPKK